MAKQMPWAGLDDRGVDADDPAAAVDERAAAVAGVQGGVGLDDVVHQVAGDAAQRPAQGADDAGGDGRFEAERAADGDDELADAQLRRVAERGVGQARRLGLDDGEVGPRVGADDAAGQLLAVAEADADALAAAGRRGGW